MQDNLKRMAVTAILLTVCVALAGCNVMTRLLEQQLALPTATERASAPTATYLPPTEVPTAVPIETPTLVAEATPVPSATPLPMSEEQALDIVEALTVRVYEQVSPSVVYIASQINQMDYWGYMYPSEGTGSGFVIDEDGHIVTNNHVIEGATSIEVTFYDGDIVEAQVVGTDPANDLAVLRVDVDATKLHPVDMSFQGPLKVGQRAIAIGNPYGLDWTLTTGVISSLGRPLQVSQDVTIYDAIQTDAAINPGNSGGPLLNSHGQLIGVNSAMQQGAENIGFAISLETVRRVIPALIERGYYPHPWLGVAGYSLTPEFARRLSMEMERGLLVARVYESSPAEQAGIRGATSQTYIGRTPVYVGGDVITQIDDQPITGNADMLKYLETRKLVGQRVTVILYRDGERMVKELTLAEQPR